MLPRPPPRSGMLAASPTSEEIPVADARIQVEIDDAGVADCASVLAGAIDPLACNDDTGGCDGFTSEITAPVVSGETYLLRVGGFAAEDEGTGTINIACMGGDPPSAWTVSSTCLMHGLSSGTWLRVKSSSWAWVAES